MRELGTWILQGCACTTPRIKRGLGLYRLACPAEDANFDRMLHPIVELTDSPSGPVRHVNLEQRINNKSELTMLLNHGNRIWIPVQNYYRPHTGLLGSYHARGCLLEL